MVRGGRGDRGTIGAVMLEVLASEHSRGEGKRGLPLRRNRRQRRRQGETSEDGEGVEGTDEAAPALVAPTSSACAGASDHVKNLLGIGAPAPPPVAAPTLAQSLGLSEADYEEAMQLQLQHQERRKQAAAEARAKEQETKARAEAEAEAKKAEAARHKAEQEAKAKAKAAEARTLQAQADEAQRQAEEQERLREQSQKQKAAEVEARQREAQARYEAEQKAEQKKAREQARREKVRRDAEAAEEEQAKKDAAARRAQAKAAGEDAAQASVVEWGPERQRALELALKQFKQGTEKRWDNIAASVGLPREACLARCKQIKSELARERAPAASSAASSGATPTVPPPTASADGWSVDQQQAFDLAATKYHEREWGRKRWEKIASHVPGKSAQQCEDHARQLKSNPGLLRGRKSDCKPSEPGPSAPPPQEKDWQGHVAEAQHEKAAERQNADVKVELEFNHSTFCCDELKLVLVKLQKALMAANSDSAFKRIAPGRIKGDGSRKTVTELQLKIKGDTPDPSTNCFEICATKGTSKQDVFVTVSKTAADGEKAPYVRLQDAIDEALGRTEKEGGALEPEPEPQRRPRPAKQRTDEEDRQRIHLLAERDENLTAEEIDGRLGDRAKDANDRRAEERRAANCATHKENHTRKVEREKAAKWEKQVASAERKLRPKKEFVASTSRTGCAGKLDRGALGTGAHAKDRLDQKALTRAHAEDAASRGRC